VAKSVDLMDEGCCPSSSALFMRPLAPSLEKPGAQLSVLDVVEGRWPCLSSVLRRLLFLLSKSPSIWAVGVIVLAFSCWSVEQNL
jgi:hypothetical protein